MVAHVSIRRLALLLLLPACYTWRPVTLAPNTGYERDGRVRVEKRAHSTDSLNASADSASKSKKRVVLDSAWVDGDSLHGFRYAQGLGVRYGRWTGSRQNVAIPVADVQRSEERRLSGWRTTFGLVAVAGFVLVLYAAALAGAATAAY